MSACTHPSSALFTDRQQGKVTCTLCGDVVMDDQFELDPVFAQGGRTGGGGAAGRRGFAGSFRPSTAVATGGLGGAPSHSHSRPTIEKARREMSIIARGLQISEETIEAALGIYKVALGMNVVSGTRMSVLCACLYAACRRERTSHVIYDFAESCDESPHAILRQMKAICHATHTELPVADPSCYVQHLAEALDLKEKVQDVVVCALKVLRAMQEDWIACGRRPMGVCAAALLVACCVFGIPRTPEQVCGMVRLTANTIAKRLTEFAETPTATLENIDDYAPSQQTLPPAFGESSLKSTEEDVHASIRELSAIYYELLAEAKTSQPATPERCDKWRRFVQKHCELEGIPAVEENLNLSALTAEQQLHILGLPNAKPISPEEVRRSVKEEEHKLFVKREDSTQRSNDGITGGAYRRELPMNPFPVHDVGSSPDNIALALSKAGTPMGNMFSDAHYGAGLTDPFTAPEDVQWMTDQYTRLLNTNAEVMQLRDDFDFKDEDAVTDAMLPATQNDIQMLEGPSQRESSPTPGIPTIGVKEQLTDWDMDEMNMRVALEDLLYDRERRHALPWEFLVLQPIQDDDCSDFLPYLVLDNEERLRRQKVGQELYRDKWLRGRARTEEEIERLEEARAAKRRRPGYITEPAANLPSAMERALRGRGAGTVNVSQIDEILPGLLGDAEDDVHAEWD